MIHRYPTYAEVPGFTPPVSVYFLKKSQPKAVAYNRTFFFFFSLAKDVPIFVDFHFPCLTMDTIFFVIYSFYSLHVWELLA
jgi:hypothetical protein